MKHLFVEKSWSALQISRFTGWPKTSVIDAIRLHDLSREPKARLKARYGWKVEGDELVPHVRQQLVIAKMKKWREEGMALNAIAKRLNETGVASPQGKSWDHKTVQGILHRESASESTDAMASPASAEIEQVNPVTGESV